MRYRALPRHVGVIVLGTLLAECSDSSSPSRKDDVVSFEVNGQAHVYHATTDFVGAGVDGERLAVRASGLNVPALRLDLSGYYGPATYALGEAGPGFARLTVGDIVYQTTGPENDGSLTISSARCSTRTEHDPVTGITGPVTTCAVRGTFAFIAASETGEVVVVTRGSFSATSVRGGGQGIASNDEGRPEYQGMVQTLCYWRSHVPATPGSTPPRAHSKYVGL
jgi:hypothetical protein